MVVYIYICLLLHRAVLVVCFFWHSMQLLSPGTPTHPCVIHDISAYCVGECVTVPVIRTYIDHHTCDILGREKLTTACVCDYLPGQGIAQTLDRSA